MRISYNRPAKQATPMQAIAIGLLFMIIGIAVLCFGLSQNATYSEKDANFIEVTATVVDYNVDSDGLYAIVAEYEVDGETYTKVSNSYSNMPQSIGAEVQVKYNPKNPVDAIWVNDSSNIIVPGFGGVFALFGAFFAVKGFKDRKQKAIPQQNMMY